MAVNKRKILETARKLAQKGAKEKALKEYAKLLKLDPKDAKLRLEVGDAHRRWGQVDEAIDTYKRVAEQYMTEGFDARAVAVYKQIVNLNPDCLEAYSPLAELYERMGLGAEAISALQTAADGYHRQGKKSEALDLLRKMANADPTNTTSRIKVADLLRQEDMAEEALSEYALVAEELERQGDVETISSVYRRMLELDETHVGALGALARNLAGRKKIAEAVPLAERALELDAGTAEHYETLAGLYEQSGQEEERTAVYRKLSDLYRERGDDDMARSIMQRFVPSEDLALDPAADASSDSDEADAGDLFGDGFDAGAQLAGAPSLDFGNERLDVPELGDGPVLELVDDVESANAAEPPSAEDDAISLDQPVAGQPAARAAEPVSSQPAASAAEPVAPPEAPAAPPAAPLGETVDVEQLLAEASVYLRYGKRDRAIAHLERVLEAEPENLVALDKLGESFAEAGESERAVEVWVRAAKRAAEEEDASALETLTGRIGALDPEAAARIAPAQPESPAAAPEPPAAPEAEPEVEIDVDLSGLEDDLTLEDDGDDDLIDEELSLPEIETGAQEGTSEAPALGAEAGAEAAPLPTSLEAALEASASDPMGASLSAVSTALVQEDLDEAEFYMDQGLQEEAERIYQRVLTAAPNHPRALLRLGELAAARGADPTAAAPVAPSPQARGEANDLLADDALGEESGGAALSEELGSAALDAELGGDALGEELALEDDVSVPDLRPELEGSESEAAFEDPSLLAGSAEEASAAEPEDAVEPEPEVASPTAVEPEPEVASPTAVEPEPEVAARAVAEPERDPLSIELPQDEPVVGQETLEDLSDLDLDPDASEESGESEPDGSDTEEFELGDGGGEFDLAAALADAFDDEVDPGASASGRPAGDDGFNAVFDAFKKGVSETLGEGDHQAHYDLAIAYKEMGLHDDALAELELAMSDESRRAECLHLMALCAYDADRVPLAVEHLGRLLALPGLVEDAALAARFDLGRALISVGDAEGAREAWTEVAEARPGFQDVESRLAELDLPEPESAPEPEEGGDFESFEDMMDGVLDDEASGPGLEPEPQAAETETGSAPDPEAADSEPDPEPGSPKPTSDRKKKKKKISFV